MRIGNEVRSGTEDGSHGRMELEELGTRSRDRDSVEMVRLELCLWWT